MGENGWLLALISWNLASKGFDVGFLLSQGHQNSTLCTTVLSPITADNLVISNQRDKVCNCHRIYQLTFLSLVFRLDGMGVAALAGVTLGFTIAGGGVVTLMSEKCSLLIFHKVNIILMHDIGKVLVFGSYLAYDYSCVSQDHIGVKSLIQMLSTSRNPKLLN